MDEECDRADRRPQALAVESVDVSLGVVPEALPRGRATTAAENGCLSFDILLIHV